MKTKKEKQQSFTKEMKKLKKEGLLKGDKNSFFEVIKKAIKPRPTSR